MKVIVQVPAMVDGSIDYQARQEHTGDDVEAFTEDGELVVHVRNADGALVHWIRYAQMQWIRVWLEEGMAPEVVAARAQAAEFRRHNPAMSMMGSNSGPN